jgi:hypothetical protein
VEVKAGEITRVTRPLQAVGYLSLNTVPSAASVVIKNATEEAITLTTPIRKMALKTGVYSLSVQKPGYPGWKLSVTIEKGLIVKKDLNLRGEEKGRKWPWILGGVAVVAGGVAAVLLTQGDALPEAGSISEPPSHP